MRLFLLTGAFIRRMAFFILFWRFLIRSQPQLCFSFSLFSRLSPSFAGDIQKSGFPMNISLSCKFFKLISFPDDNFFQSKSRSIQTSVAHKRKTATSSFRFGVSDQMLHPLVTNFKTASVGISVGKIYLRVCHFLSDLSVVQLKIASFFKDENSVC